MSTNTNTNTAAGLANSPNRLDAVRKELEGFGKQTAAGIASRPDAALAVTRHAFDGTIDEDDAQAVYSAYTNAVSKELGKRGVAADSGSEKAQVSKFRAFIKAGMLPAVDMPAILDEAKRIHHGMMCGEAGAKPLFDALLSVCRAQVKAPDTPLTNEEIGDAMAKPETADKDEITRLIEVYKSARKRAEAMAGNTALAVAVEALKEAIVEAGGEVPPLSKAEKEAAAATEYLRRNGMVAVHALAAE